MQQLEQDTKSPKGLVFHPAYEPLFAPLPKGVSYVVVTGGRGSGKSFSVSSALGIQMHNYGHRILYTRYTLLSASDSIIPEFKEKLDLLGIGGQYNAMADRIDGPGNRKVVFKGLRSSSGDQSARLKSLKDFSCFVLDEAEECNDKESFDKIDLSLRPTDVQALVVLILNPPDKNHWIYKEFFESRGVAEGFDAMQSGEPYRIIGDTLYIHTTYLDNIENLPEDYIRKAEKMKIENPKLYEHIWLGRFAEKAEGVVFTNWRYANEGEFDWDHLVFDGYGLDFGSRDPDALVAVKIYQKQRKILAKQCLYESGLSTRDLAFKVKSITGRDLVIGDKSARRTIQDLKGYGVNIKEGKEFTKGKIISDVKVLKEYEIILHPGSLDMGKELNSWVWLDKAAEKTLDGWCHCFTHETPILTDRGIVPISSVVPKVDRVFTAKGYRGVNKLFDNGVHQISKYSLQFDTFSISLRCTDNHKIKTTQGWKRISELRGGEQLFLLRFTTEEPTISTQGRSTIQGPEKDCTSECGRMQTVLFQKVTASTIRTKTRRIIASIILRLCRRESTYEGMQRSLLGTIPNGLRGSMETEGRPLRNGTDRRKGWSGIVSRLKGSILGIKPTAKENAKFVGLFLKRKTPSNDFAEIDASQNTEDAPGLMTSTKSVKDVELFLGPINMQTENFVQNLALVSIKSENQAPERVYDLEVDGVHEYFANGILVHNCLDGFRYICRHIIKPVGSGKGIKKIRYK